MVETSMKAARRYRRPCTIRVPLHLQPVFAHLRPAEPAASRCPKPPRARVISLPMHPYLTDEQQQTVVDALARSRALTSGR